MHVFCFFLNLLHHYLNVEVYKRHFCFFINICHTADAEWRCSGLRLHLSCMWRLVFSSSSVCLSSPLRGNILIQLCSLLLSTCSYWCPCLQMAEYFQMEHLEPSFPVLEQGLSHHDNTPYRSLSWFVIF